MFQVNPLLGIGFTLKSKPYFRRKIKVKKLKCRLLQFWFGALMVNPKKANYCVSFAKATIVLARASEQDVFRLVGCLILQLCEAVFPSVATCYPEGWRKKIEKITI